MAKCKKCGAEIIFITTINLKNMPCDPEPIKYWERKGAKGKVVTRNGEVLSCDFEGDIDQVTGYGYLPHWGKCKSAKEV